MPVILSLVWGAFSKVFGALFTFFTTRPGVYIGMALLILLAIWWSGQHGYERGQAACEARHVAAAQKEKIREVIVYRDAQQRSDERTAKSDAKRTSNKEILAHVEEQVAAQPNAAADCVSAVSADELRKLQ